jgi:hypothetical protein
MVDETIDRRQGHGLIREDFSPFAERLIGGDEHRSSFVASADQFEQNAGALRLAAHQALGEPPHFGGEYSKRLIEDGIAAIESAFKPPPRKKPLTKRKAVMSQETQTNCAIVFAAKLSRLFEESGGLLATRDRTGI